MELKDLGLQKINLDLSNNMTENFFAKEGDIGTRGLSIKVLNNSVEIDTTGVSIAMYARVGQEVYSVDAIVKDALKGEYELIYPTSILKSGIVYAELQLKKLNDIISTKKFKILVESGIVTDSAIEGHDSYPIFEQLLEAGTNEVTRIANEEIRKLNETARDDAESLRGVRLGELEVDFTAYKEEYVQNVVKLKNEVVNGDFSEGSSGWKGLTSATIISENKLTINTASGFGIYQPFSPDVGDDVYLQTEYINDGVAEIIMSCRLGIVESTIPILTVKNSTSLTIQSHIFKIASLCDGFYINRRSNTSNTIIFTKFKLLNLTKTFGKGNEPTKEEMDLLIDQIGWFDGEITLSQKQILNWQLTLIRQNRNAIIELGGTI